jgi:hypothetical protein
MKSEATLSETCQTLTRPNTAKGLQILLQCQIPMNCQIRTACFESTSDSAEGVLKTSI